MTLVFDLSAATLGSRLILLALADAAHDDGITWTPQDTIAKKAKLSQAHVRECLRGLEESGELQTRKAQRGRKRINVYRVTLYGIAEADYERLPFTLKEPFTATAEIPRPSFGDDRGSDGPTTAGMAPHSRERGTTGEPKGKRQGANAPNAREKPPPIFKVEERYLGFDTLRATCSISEGDRNREDEVGIALAGGRGIKTGIRQLAWSEIVAAHFDGDFEAALEAVAEEPVRFERALVALIERRAQMYATAMRGAMLTPFALAKWWLSLETLPRESGGGLTPEQMERFEADA